MSPAFEAFLARLYVDADARTRFLEDPGGAAAAAGLAEDEIAAAVRIDRVGLELAAAGFAHKRRRQKRRPHRLVQLWRRVTGRASADGRHRPIADVKLASPARSDPR
ncbi:MAG TPA: hypothetical protein VJ813_04900 [Vicinamibacterales bacterium]|nr:hypothetical protein [Vicinamibacterales bacterium]